VTNTRFGSFPHSTLVGLPWGSQVRASLVDTGSRGRRPLRPPVGQKRKAADIGDGSAVDVSAVLDFEGLQQKEAVAASSGFIHVLPPTPENWTISLPHRTQVVYTPDYSYILHRIRARPGSVLIEAGSGSGSFTHAAARAVFNGFPESVRQLEEEAGQLSKKRKIGRVFSYEFHADRYEKVREEMKQHGLDRIVTVTERDVYGQGFSIPETGTAQSTATSANCIFLDLPAPWQALPHLTRGTSSEDPSPLDPQQAVHICTFSPCIEQAQKTVSALRRHGWLEIEMVEMQQKRIDVRREYTGLEYEGMRGVNATAATVDEAISKLKQVEERSRDFRTGQHQLPKPKKQKPQHIGNQEARHTLFKDGSLVHRPEPELKTHTSYLVFAILPMQWTETDEARARSQWGAGTVEHHQPLKSSRSRKQLKRDAMQNALAQNQFADDGKMSAQADQAGQVPNPEEDLIEL
jgi:tRNA (adenine57-N1/adenine58-N1)-methyltransferase catalytic subunit